MSSTPQYVPDGAGRGGRAGGGGGGGERRSLTQDATPLTRAVFSPATLSCSPAGSRQRSSIIVQQKSPLLATTPPRITRVLAYSHPILLPLNHLVGLLSWTTDDPWQSFLLLVAFWGVAVYGDAVVRWTGPLLVAIGLALAIYAQRFPSVLSSTENRKTDQTEKAEDDSRRHKSLDEIVETLQVFISRCNVLQEPFVHLISRLSSPPALRSVLIRLLAITPVWIILACPAVAIITTKRLVLILGPLMLTWHSTPARVTRAILWRSTSLRRLCALATGLNFHDAPTIPLGRARKVVPPPGGPHTVPPTHQPPSAASDLRRTSQPTGIRFTFTIWENQRRWLGLGWTNSLFVYERTPWTDEHLNALPPKDHFRLPDVGDGGSLWRWVDGRDWHVEGARSGRDDGIVNGDDKGKGSDGWIFYDGKWRDGRRQDGWGRYTRRRKWCRDAELIEISNGGVGDVDNPPNESVSTIRAVESHHHRPLSSTLANPQSEQHGDSAIVDETRSISSANSNNDDVPGRRKWFKRGSRVVHSANHVPDGDRSEATGDDGSLGGTTATASEDRSRGDGIRDDGGVGGGNGKITEEDDPIKDRTRRRRRASDRDPTDTSNMDDQDLSFHPGLRPSSTDRINRQRDCQLEMNDDGRPRPDLYGEWWGVGNDEAKMTLG